MGKPGSFKEVGDGARGRQMNYSWVPFPSQGIFSLSSFGMFILVSYLCFLLSEKRKTSVTAVLSFLIPPRMPQKRYFESIHNSSHASHFGKLKTLYTHQQLNHGSSGEKCFKFFLKILRIRLPLQCDPSIFITDKNTKNKQLCSSPRM